MKTIASYSAILLSSGILVTSCVKDRVDTNEYVPMNDFYTAHQPEEQQFIIDSTHTDTIIGKEGTYVWNVGNTNFMYKKDYADVTYPYVLKLIEAYTLKNKILLQQPTLAQGNLLACEGQIKLTMFKNDEELMLKENHGINTWKQDNNTDASMQLHYGFTKNSTTDWNSNLLLTDYIFSADNTTDLQVINSGYYVKSAKLGWYSIAKQHSSNTSASITFTDEGVNPQYIDIYIVYNNGLSFVKVSNLSINNLPNDETVTILAIAKTNKDKYVYHKENLKLNGTHAITLNMQETDENGILTMLGGL